MLPRTMLVYNQSMSLLLASILMIPICPRNYSQGYQYNKATPYSRMLVPRSLSEIGGNKFELHQPSKYINLYMLLEDH